MKKIVLSSIALFIFSLSIIIFQISCKKNSEAAPSTSSSIQQQNKILFQKNFTSGATGTEHAEIWTSNYDGSAQQKVNINPPSGVLIALQGIKLSPDGKTIFFNGYVPASNNTSIYSCNIDGSNVRLVVNGTSDAGVETCQAY